MYEELLRFLAMACHRLGGVDARAEIGGRSPENPCLVWFERRDGLRLVVEFARPPEDPRAAARRLRELAEAFLSGRPPPPVRGASVGGTRHELDAALASLVQRADAMAAMVTDERSPMVWGWSLPPTDWESQRTHESLRGWSNRGEEEVSRAARSLDAALRSFQARQAPESVFWVDEQSGVAWRAFAGVYRAWLTFGREVSPLHVEGALVRALPRLEKLILRWPPADPEEPGPGRGRAALRLV